MSNQQNYVDQNDDRCAITNGREGEKRLLKENLNLRV